MAPYVDVFDFQVISDDILLDTPYSHRKKPFEVTYHHRPSDLPP
jgi:hypothetical protein